CSLPPHSTARPEIYTLSLHDALPIWGGGAARPRNRETSQPRLSESSHLPRLPIQQPHEKEADDEDHGQDAVAHQRRRAVDGRVRSEEHTSELQSRGHLVCRLLLEKKK